MWTLRQPNAERLEPGRGRGPLQGAESRVDCQGHNDQLVPCTGKHRAAPKNQVSRLEVATWPPATS
jgi:hypothetical protein